MSGNLERAELHVGQIGSFGGRQKSHPADAWIQVVLECSNPYRRHRNNADDQEGADGLSRRINHARSQPFLQPCRLITWLAEQLFSAPPYYCDRTGVAHAWILDAVAMAGLS